MKEKKNNIIIYILFTIAGILIGIGIGYGVYTFSKNTNNTLNNESKSNSSEKKKIEVKFETKSGEYESVISKMTINGIEVMNYIDEKNIFNDTKIDYDSNENVAVVSFEEYSTGYIYHNLYIFDENGKLVKLVRNIKDNEFDYGYGYTGKYTLDKNNSTVQYDVELVYDETGCGYEYKGKCFSDLSKETIKSLENKEDHITYEISYINKNTTANPKKKSFTLLKDNLKYKNYLN